MSPVDRMAGSVPGLLDTLSCGSTADISYGDREPSIPQIVQACFRHLENFGLHTLGIFRVSSSKKRVRQVGTHWELTGENCMSSKTYRQKLLSHFMVYKLHQQLLKLLRKLSESYENVFDLSNCSNSRCIQNTVAVEEEGNKHFIFMWCFELKRLIRLIQCSIITKREA
jgi:hypothetical protein